MQKSDSNQSLDAHRRVEASSTLNRRYVKRPDIMSRTPEPHPLQASAKAKMNRMSDTPARPTAKELKDAAIKKALDSAAKVDTKTPKKSSPKFHFSFGRVMLALGCTVAAVFAIVYFANMNMPDVPLRVAAIQTGIDAVYPKHIPRDFSISGITSEDGKITMVFDNPSAKTSYSISEEKSSWDSTALLNNFVKPEYGDNYDTIREQGLTLYVSGSNACWVNGGIVFKIKTTSGSLTKKQIRAIAVSL